MLAGLMVETLVASMVIYLVLWMVGMLGGLKVEILVVLMEWFMAATLADSWVGQLVGVQELLRDRQMVELMVVQMDGDLNFWKVVHWAGAWVVSWVVLKA